MTACRFSCTQNAVNKRNADVSPATTKEVELTGRATTSTLQSYPRETSGNPRHQFTGNNHKSFQEGRMTHEEHRSGSWRFCRRLWLGRCLQYLEEGRL